MTFPSYYDFDRTEPQTCSACGHLGPPECEAFDEFLRVACGSCDLAFAHVPFPTVEETRAAAAAGDPAAAGDLPAAKRWYRRLKRAARLELTSRSALPWLGIDPIVIVWDQVTVDGEEYTVLRHETTELWRELAYWEGYERFRDVAVLLHQRYGAQLRGLKPTAAAGTYLYGDRMWTPDACRDINEQLARGASPTTAT